MSTTTRSGRSRSGTNSKTKKKRSGGGRARSSRGKGSRTRRSSGGSQPGLASRVLAALRLHVGDQRDDVLGLGLILVGVVAGLGLYVHAAGPVGAFLEAVLRGLLGVYGYAVPPLLVYFGGHVVLDRPSQERGRIGVGVGFLGIAAVGGWHLIQGVPEPSQGVRVLWPAGGLVGWGVSAPLTAALSTWGAAAVFLALLALGTLIVTQTPIAHVWRAVRGVFAADEPATARSSGRTTSSTSTAGSGAAGDEPTEETREKAVLRLDETEEDAPANGQTAADVAAGRAPAPPKPEPSQDLAPLKARKLVPVTDWARYELPPVAMLANGRRVGQQAQRTIDAQAQALQATLDEFGIDANVARRSRGPTVTRFEIELGPGVQVKKVANLGQDIAYALAAPDVRIVAPIPGKSAIGVEVPNRERDLVTLRDILESEVARADDHPLFVALGVDIAGNPAMVNLATMPHLLVSGATGSGKSVTLNAMITSVVLRARPDQVRMILIDPKRVELNHYDGAPHLLTPVVTDPRRATDALEWAVKEMEMRYETLARLGFRNIDGYNDAVAKGELADLPGVVTEDDEGNEVYRHMPYILLVIDELSDLMMVAPRDVEDAICRIAQMARAVGIHMVIATQRPSVDVITGLIKANIPSRLSLAVASQTDSRTILDMGGAEKLVGHGDMLFLPASQGKPSRLQGCFVSEKEIRSLVEFCKRQREADYVDGVVKEGKDADELDIARGTDDDSDEALVRRAAALVVESGLGSTSMLQRKLRIGFARAGRVMDELEQLGVVGPNEGSKAREVLWTPEELEERASVLP